jgi:glycosyltransferase involved in cell wall biosynthesis
MDDYKIKLSIIILTYNHEKYIRDCLDSVFEQKTKYNYEIIVGNDCSPDNTINILKEYEIKFKDQIKVINRPINIGATKNLYNLITVARGEYIIFLEGDDYWTSSSKIEMLVDYLENNKEYIGVYHTVNEIDENSNIISTYPDTKEFNNKDLDVIEDVSSFLDMIIKGRVGQVIHIQSILFRNIFRDISKDIRELITVPSIICDLQIKLLILENGKIKFIQQNLGNYRRIRKKGGTSFSSRSSEFVYSESLMIWDLINKYFRNKYDDKIKIIINEIRYNAVITFIKDKRLFRAFYYFKVLHFGGKSKVVKFLFSKLIKYFRR